MGFFKTIGNIINSIFKPSKYKDVDIYNQQSVQNEPKQQYSENYTEQFTYIESESERIGNIGEQFTYDEIKLLYDRNQILRNVYLKKNNGHYTEIDLLLISEVGIFVFESKNYSGWIFGDESQAKWMQILKHGYRTQFYNPVWQNNTHIKSIKYLLNNYKNIRYFSIIVFSERCTLKEITCKSKDTYVINRYELKNLLNYIEKENATTISKSELIDITKLLSKHVGINNEIKKQHLKDLNESFQKCPRCKSNLVERKNKQSGEIFYGCNGFPECTYTTKELRQVQSTLLK